MLSPSIGRPVSVSFEHLSRKKQRQDGETIRSQLQQTRWPPPLAQTAHHMNCSCTTCAPQDRSSADRVELAMPGAMRYSTSLESRQITTKANYQASNTLDGAEVASHIACPFKYSGLIVCFSLTRYCRCHNPAPWALSGENVLKWIRRPTRHAGDGCTATTQLAPWETFFSRWYPGLGFGMAQA